MTSLFVAHRAHLDLPTELEPIRVATSAPDLMSVRRDDTVLFGEPGFAVALSTVPRGALLLSWRAEVVAEARRLGWRALQLPGPERAAIARAARHPEALVEVEHGTIDVGAGAMWTTTGIVALPPRELELLTALVAGERPVDPPAGSVRRLRARIGRSHVSTVDGTARFRALGPSPAPAVARPTRAAAALGDTVLDLDGLRIVHPDREVALTAREAATVALLHAAPGVVSRDELARAMRTPARHRHALDLAISRLRAKLAPIELRTVRGHGYLLVRSPARPAQAAAAPADPEVQQVVDLLAGAAPVLLSGPCGVGKSHLARRVAAAVGARIVDVHGLDPARTERALARARATPGRVVFDGLDDAAPWSDALRPCAGWLVTARAGATSCREVAVQPWPLARLEALDPRADASLDGLPLALEPDALGARIDALAPPALAALAALARLPGPLTESDGVNPALVRLGWLVGTGPWRMRRPVLAHLRSRWTEPDWARYTSIVLERGRATLDAVPYRRTAVEEVYPEVVAAHDRTDDPALAALRVDLHREIAPWDPRAVTWIARALDRAEEPALRADLLYHLAEGAEVVQLDLLARSAELSVGEIRLERQILLAAHLSLRGSRTEALALMTEVERALDALEPDACMYVRGDLAVLKAKTMADPERVAMFVALLGRMEAARWTRADFPAGHRRTNVARAQLAQYLAKALMRLQRVDEAEVALDVARDAVDEDHSPELLINLAELAVRRDRWKVADELLVKAERAAEYTGFASSTIRALLHRAQSWVFRGEPSRAAILLERAAGLPACTEPLEILRAEVIAWRAVVVGDPEPVDRSTPLGALLGAAAELVAATRAGVDTGSAPTRLRLASAGVDPYSVARLESVLASAGVHWSAAATDRDG